MIDLLEGELDARGLVGPVSTVLFRAGKLRAIVPDSLMFFFDVMKVDRPRLAEARLEIEELPLMVRCDPCGESTELDVPFFICRACGHPVRVESGQEMYIESFTVNDQEGESHGDPHRTERPGGE
jgi:hydrogenase nickel incorporation protein HypA/HybF